MRDNIETTFKTRVMYITMDRTRTNPIAPFEALPYGNQACFREMARNCPARGVSLQKRLYGGTEVGCLPAAGSKAAT
jgi:hypothetical protein